MSQSVRTARWWCHRSLRLQRRWRGWADGIEGFLPYTVVESRQFPPTLLNRCGKAVFKNCEEKHKRSTSSRIITGCWQREGTLAFLWALTGARREMRHSHSIRSQHQHRCKLRRTARQRQSSDLCPSCPAPPRVDVSSFFYTVFPVIRHHAHDTRRAYTKASHCCWEKRERVYFSCANEGLFILLAWCTQVRDL